MSPLDDFFARMDAFFADPANTSAEHGRLAIYARFVRGHVGDVLGKNFPLVRKVVGEDQWSALVDRYYETRPGTHFEVNQAAAGFPSFSADLGTELPPFVPALARFEWSDFEVYASEERIPSTVEVLTPNPTLTVLQHPFRIAAWIRQGNARPAAPEAGDETVLMWRHPGTHRTTFVIADPRALLVLKLAVEQIPLETAARESGLPQGELQSLVAAFARDGMVIDRPLASK